MTAAATAADPIAALLDEATAVVRDPVRTIELVLAAWRLVRASALAEVVDELTPWLPARDLLIRRRKVWQQVAAEGQPGDVPALLRSIPFAWLPAELITMLTWPLDPRVTLCLATELPRAPIADRLAIIAHLVELGDPRTVTPVCAVIGSTADEFATLRRRAAAAILSPAAAAALARLRAARAAHLAEERVLVDEVLAAPADDAPRLVYGDWLQGHEDPRGEFIALQFRRHRGRMSEPERRRERALIAAHGRRWMGGLAEWCIAFGYERGFVSEVRLISHAIVPGDLPDWATVRTIDLCANTGARVVALLTAPVMRSLRAVVGADGALVAELGGQPTPVGLERIVSRAPDRLTDDPVALGRAPGLPDLRVLELQGGAGWLVGCDLLGRLRRLELRQHGDHPELGPWLAAVLAGGHALEHIVIRNNGVTIRLGPGPGRLARLEVTWVPGHNFGLRNHLEPLLAALPVASVAVCAVGDAVDRVLNGRFSAMLWARQPGAIIEPVVTRSADPASP